jgi:hypothetical protein
METKQLKKPQLSVKTMSDEEKDRVIKKFQQEADTTTDIKKKMKLLARIKYIQNPDSKKQKRRELYLKKNQDNIQKRCQEKLARLEKLKELQTNN